MLQNIGTPIGLYEFSWRRGHTSLLTLYPKPELYLVQGLLLAGFEYRMDE